jgi:anti-sigma regulatory factor (Ser/Thr protein kinase)
MGTEAMGSTVAGGGATPLVVSNGKAFGVTDLALTLPSVPESVPTARHRLEGLSERLGGSQLEKLRLLVSEVVSNSVRHGDGAGPIELRITVNTSTVRVEVEDPGPGFRPTAVEVEPIERHQGWGLLLLERMADRWGVVASGSTLVWFELDRSPEESGPAGFGRDGPGYT